MVWVRLLVGAVWLNGGVEKLLNPNFSSQFADALAAGGFIAQAPLFFQGFMQDYVVPNAGLVAQVSRFGELLLGLALILGLFTNFAAVGSILLSTAILLSQGGVGLGGGLASPEFVTINLLIALLSAVILFSVAAKAFSLDTKLARSNPGMSTLLVNRRQRRRA